MLIRAVQQIAGLLWVNSRADPNSPPYKIITILAHVLQGCNDVISNSFKLPAKFWPIDVAWFWWHTEQKKSGAA